MVLDYREGGTFCVANPATLMLWRPNMEGDTALEIESAGKKSTVAIVDGANFRKWPTDVLPVQYGVDYRLSGGGLTETRATAGDEGGVSLNVHGVVLLVFQAEGFSMRRAMPWPPPTQALAMP